MTVKIETAMIIDDERVDQRIYQRVLKKSGIVENVLSFQYADEALEYIKVNEYLTIDVIFLDINMPRMNGFQFLDKAAEELQREIAQVVIIMLTTSLNPADRERASMYEMVRDFINKPLEVSHVEHAAKLLADVKS